MNRREFTTLLGGAAAWPLTSRAQQQLRRIAILLAGLGASDAEDQARLQALLRALQQLGWSEGRNVYIDVRFASGSSKRVQDTVASLVGVAPDVIVSSGSVATAALKRATSSIPVVFVLVNEPDSQGFVASLARPGGNITGFSNIDFSVLGKWMALLKTTVPAVRRIGLLFNPDNYPLYDKHLGTFQIDPHRPVEVVRAAVRSSAEISTVIDALATEPGSGLAVLPDGGFTVAHRAEIQAAVNRNRLPTITPWRQFVVEGALISYGPETTDIFRRSADYVDRILKGAMPADLPVQQPVKFELVLNRKTAAALGVEIPPTLLALADEVIE
jgi:putative tryptophan/tyrosine transport system substrate-binding protein